MAHHWFENRWVASFIIVLFIVFVVLFIMWSTEGSAFNAYRRSDVGGANDNFPDFYAPSYNGTESYASLAAQGYQLDPDEYYSTTIQPVVDPGDIIVELTFALRDPSTDKSNRQILMTSAYALKVHTTNQGVVDVPSGIGIRAVATFDTTNNTWVWVFG